MYSMNSNYSNVAVMAIIIAAKLTPLWLINLNRVINNKSTSRPQPKFEAQRTETATPALARINDHHHHLHRAPLESHFILIDGQFVGSSK